MNNQRQAPIIYNLFPRIAGAMTDWLQHGSPCRRNGLQLAVHQLNPLHGVPQPLGCEASLP